MAQTVGTQKRGNVSISLAPVPFDTIGAPSCEYSAAPPTLFVFTPKDVSVETHTKMTEVRYASLNVRPTELSFLLTIRNGMSRVFRGTGAVVQFRSDQQLQAVEQSNYIDFINALLPPGGESQIRIKGPSLSALTTRDTSLLAVSIFDVAVEIDNAGNVTKRENYDWIFQVVKQRIVRQVSASSSNVWVPNMTLAAIARAGGTQRFRGCLNTD